MHGVAGLSEEVEGFLLHQSAFATDQLEESASAGVVHHDEDLFLTINVRLHLHHIIVDQSLMYIDLLL